MILAGGYRGHYVISDDFGRQITFGGRSLDRVWMFDGAYWEEMAPMDTVRDRPACSLFSGAQGKIKVSFLQISFGNKRQQSITLQGACSINLWTLVGLTLILEVPLSA